MFGLFKRTNASASQLVEGFDPGNRVSNYHNELLGMQRNTLEMFAHPEDKHEKLTPAQFLQAMCFSRGVIYYLAEYSLPKDATDEAFSLWAFTQQVLIAEMFASHFSDDVAKRAIFLELSLKNTAQGTPAYIIQVRGFETAHKVAKRLKDGDLGDAVFGLSDTLVEFATVKNMSA